MGATRLFLSVLVAAAVSLLDPATAALQPNYTSPLGVEIYNPSTSINATGPWSLMSRAGPMLYIAGMRGIYPSSETVDSVPASPQQQRQQQQQQSDGAQPAPGYARVRLAFENMRDLAQLAGTDLTSCARLVVYVTDMYRWRPLVNRVQEELWTDSASYPPRTIIEVQRLNDDDIVEVEGTFWVG